MYHRLSKKFLSISDICLIHTVVSAHTRSPGIVQELQWRSWASWLPTRFNFRRATTTPQIPEGLADVRFQSVSVGASFFLAIDGTPPLLFCVFFCFRKILSGVAFLVPFWSVLVTV